MRFSYRLQSILDWKKNLEEQSKMRLARKVERLKEQEEEVQRLIQKRFKNDEELHQKMKEGISLGEYLIHKQYGEGSYKDLLFRKGLKKRAEMEIVGERENLIGLMKERKILEKIKERRLRKFFKEMEKKEQDKMDEWFVERSPTFQKK